jgi:hypothetical protein
MFLERNPLLLGEAAVPDKAYSTRGKERRKERGDEGGRKQECRDTRKEAGRGKQEVEDEGQVVLWLEANC